MTRTCGVQNCRNGVHSLCKWRESLCTIHLVQNGDCSCSPPFELYPLPSQEKEPELRKLWILQMNRDDMIVSAQTRICSDHFDEGNPWYPTKNLTLPSRVKATQSMDGTSSAIKDNQRGRSANKRVASSTVTSSSRQQGDDSSSRQQHDSGSRQRHDSGSRQQHQSGSKHQHEVSSIGLAEDGNSVMSKSDSRKSHHSSSSRKRQFSSSSRSQKDAVLKCSRSQKDAFPKSAKAKLLNSEYEGSSCDSLLSEAESGRASSSGAKKMRKHSLACWSNGKRTEPANKKHRRAGQGKPQDKARNSSVSQHDHQSVPSKSRVKREHTRTADLMEDLAVNSGTEEIKIDTTAAVCSGRDSRVQKRKKETEAAEALVCLKFSNVSLDSATVNKQAFNNVMQKAKQDTPYEGGYVFANGDTLIDSDWSCYEGQEEMGKAYNMLLRNQDLPSVDPEMPPCSGMYGPTQALFFPPRSIARRHSSSCSHSNPLGAETEHVPSPYTQRFSSDNPRLLSQRSPAATPGSAPANVSSGQRRFTVSSDGRASLFFDEAPQSQDQSDSSVEGTMAFVSDFAEDFSDRKLYIAEDTDHLSSDPLLARDKECFFSFTDSTLRDCVSAVRHDHSYGSKVQLCNCQCCLQKDVEVQVLKARVEHLQGQLDRLREQGAEGSAGGQEAWSVSRTHRPLMMADKSPLIANWLRSRKQIHKQLGDNLQLTAI